MQLFESNPAEFSLAKNCGLPPPNTPCNGRKHMLFQVTMATGALVSKVIFWQVAEGGSINKTGSWAVESIHIPGDAAACTEEDKATETNRKLLILKSPKVSNTWQRMDNFVCGPSFLTHLSISFSASTW